MILNPSNETLDQSNFTDLLNRGGFPLHAGINVDGFDMRGEIWRHAGKSGEDFAKIPDYLILWGEIWCRDNFWSPARLGLKML